MPAKVYPGSYNIRHVFHYFRNSGAEGIPQNDQGKPKDAQKDPKSSQPDPMDAQVDATSKNMGPESIEMDGERQRAHVKRVGWTSNVPNDRLL